jgi:dephospho-CoA kinase
MIKIGVTGNIGSGKTTFSNLFKKKSFIFNADKEAKKYLNKHSVLQKKLVNVFGKEILTGTDLDFKKLAHISFKNEINQKILNGIIWPEVGVLITNALESAEKEKYQYFIVDAALLFEANFQHFFDYIILVIAEKDIRLKRAIKRRNINLSQIKKRMALQLSDKEKIKNAHFVINNNLDTNNLKKQFNEVFKKLI